MPYEQGPDLRAAADREKRGVALSSLLAAVVLTAFKLAIGLWTNSLGILSRRPIPGWTWWPPRLRFGRCESPDCLPTDDTPTDTGNSRTSPPCWKPCCCWPRASGSSTSRSAAVLCGRCRGNGQRLGLPRGDRLDRDRLLSLLERYRKRLINTTVRPWRPTHCISPQTSGRPWSCSSDCSA